MINSATDDVLIEAEGELRAICNLQLARYASQFALSRAEGLHEILKC